MSLFSKQNNWRDYTLDDNWCVIETKYKEYLMVIRKNIGISKIIGHKQLIYKIGFAVPLNKPNENSLPSNEETNVLDRIEDLLVKEIKDSAVLTLVITTKGMREFVFYGDDKNKLIKWYENGHRKILGHELQLSIDIDKSWDIYKQF